MPRKKGTYRSYGEKLISLFARLLFSGESYSLTEMARTLDCSKQTVLRLVEDIRMARGIDIDEFMEGNRKYYRLKTPRQGPPAVCLTEMELNVLYMCRAFAEHLLGRTQFEEATDALLKNRALLPKEGGFLPRHFACFRPGTIDYTHHQDTIRTLIEAMEAKKVCRLIYGAIGNEKTKTFYIQPLKIFSHFDTVYLHARQARTPGKPYQEPDYDPLLAIHRIRKVEITERRFEFPKDYDFEKTFNRAFGVMKGEPFEVEAEFTGWSAKYVSERIWSPDQKIVKKEKGKTRLIFTTSSPDELIAWLLSFAEEGRLLRPERLVKEVGERIKRMRQGYTT